MRRLTPAGFVLGMLASVGLVAGFQLLRLLDLDEVSVLLITVALLGLAAVALGSWLGGRQVRLHPLIEWLKQPALGKRRASAVPSCRRCGYDLRASPYRCPECGTRVPAEDRFVIQYLQRLLR